MAQFVYTETKSDESTQTRTAGSMLPASWLVYGGARFAKDVRALLHTYCSCALGKE